MAHGMVKPHKSAGNHQWVFRWRPLRQPLFPRLFAVALVGGAFIYLITSVRVRVVALEQSTPRKASVIFLRDDSQGRALSLRAQEGGPFPSRFELSQWGGLAALESAAMDGVRFQPPAYVPKMEDLPRQNPIEPPKFAAKGARFFPIRRQAPDPAPDAAGFKLAPVLYPLSGDALPSSLPPFDAAVDAAMFSASWRFLVRLNPAGGVVECVSLENGDDPGALELEKWLHRVHFKPEPGKPFRWMAVGIGFTNQPADGTNAR